ncbi:MAG: helix-turn-helix domain-containing protein [Candidatus Norongarragalinales archaeon]
MLLVEGKLVVEDKSVSVKLVEEAALHNLSADRLRILRALACEPKYPAQLAKEMGEQVQTLYYHVRLLQRAGLVKLVEYEEKGGALAKKYAVAADGLALVLNDSAWKPFLARTQKPPSFFKPFVSGGVFDGKMVVGSPDPHGPFRMRGSDLCAAEIAMVLGAFASFSFPLYLLDTEVRESHRKQNLLLVGGPKVNLLVAEANPFLPVRFNKSFSGVESDLSGKRYSENVGVIELVESPFNRMRKLLLVGGLNHSGTRAAVLAIAKHLSEVEKGNSRSSSVFARVVEGFDEDGDGVVDAVEFLE